MTAVRLCPMNRPTVDRTLRFSVGGSDLPGLGHTLVVDGVRYTVTEIDWEVTSEVAEPFVIARENAVPGLPGRERKQWPT